MQCKWFYKIFFLTSLIFATPLIVTASDVSLFTEQEAAVLTYTEVEWQKELVHYQEEKEQFVAKSLGPIVSVAFPEPVKDTYISSIPLSLLVYLKKRLHPIDIKSLKVLGKKFFVTVDITDKIMPFLREPQEGEDADYVIDAKVPSIDPGRYLITMSITDAQGETENMKAYLKVVD